MLNEIPEPWKSFLKEIDDTLEEETEFHCIGGFVIAMLYNFKRETSDLDFISCVPRQNDGKLYELAGEGSPLNVKYRVYLDPVTIITPPDNYDERLIEMFPGEFKYLRLYALDPYDLALSKLERNMPHDREDVLHLAKMVPFDLLTFKQRYKEELEVYFEDNIRHRSTFDFWIEMLEENRRNDS
jgi:hypothetical protein